MILWGAGGGTANEGARAARDRSRSPRWPKKGGDLEQAVRHTRAAQYEQARSTSPTQESIVR